MEIIRNDYNYVNYNGRYLEALENFYIPFNVTAGKTVVTLGKVMARSIGGLGGALGNLGEALAAAGSVLGGLADVLGAAAAAAAAEGCGDWLLPVVGGFGRSIIDPIVLDLDGDGVRLTSVSDSNAYFDLHGTGFAVKTGWIENDDGFLVVDHNSNGVIDDISELFGDATTNGFTALSSMDTNGDGVINASDAGFTTLQIWQDANGDGVTDVGELSSLASRGITQINLNAAVVNEEVNGNIIGEVATFVRADNTTSEVAEAFFDNAQYDSEYTGTYTLNPEVLLLPNLRGYGTVTDLFIAMSLDSSLLEMVEVLASSDLSSAVTFDAQIEAIIYRWSSVEAVDPEGRGNFVNGQHLAVLEAFMGQNYENEHNSSSPHAPQGESLEELWGIFYGVLKSRLLVQGPLSSLFGDVGYDFATDSLSGTLDIENVITDIFTQTPVGKAEAIQYWMTFAPFIDTLAVAFGISSSAYEVAFEGAYESAGLPYSLAIFRTYSVYMGTGGDDVLLGRRGDDYFSGGAGNDSSTGKGGNNIFTFGLGDGQDTIDNIHLDSGSSTIQMNNVVPEDIVVTRSGYDLVLSIAGTTDSVTVQNYFYTSICRVETISFESGASWNYQDVLGFILAGTSGDDVLQGDGENNMLDGLAGNDILEGNGGSDTYVFGRGYGQDVIENTNSSMTSTSILSFNADTSAADVIVERSSYNLVLTIAGTTDVVTITNYFYSWLFSITEVQFTDGTSWDFATICSKFLTGTTGNDTLTGTSANDVFDGLAGNDTQTGNGGGDTYVFGRGYGQDTINNTNSSRMSKSILCFSADTSAADVIVKRSSYNLVLTIAGTTDVVTITNYFYSWMFSLTEVQFANGTSWDYATIVDIVTTGTAGDDVLLGTSGNEILDGIAGNDTLTGNEGSDTYVFGRGYGQDTINNTNSSRMSKSILCFNADISVADVIVKRSSYNLVLTIAGTTDVVTITNYFYSWMFSLTEVQFADGTSWDYATIVDFVLTGTPGDDVLIGTSDGQVLDGLAGNDTLEGKEGNDTYVFGRGYGQDVINSIHTDGSSPVLSFKSDIAPSDIMLTKAGSDLILSVEGTTDKVTIKYYWSGSIYQVSAIQFSDGTSWSAQEVTGFLLGTSSDNTLTGTTSDNTFYSSGGIDTMIGNGGDDTYVIGFNIGQTTINNLASDGVTTARGEVAFSSNLAYEDLWFKKQGDNLVVTEIGASKTITISNWYGANERAQVESFTTSSGYSLDSQLEQLVSAMASYAANDPGFDPTSASAMPTDQILQSAIAASWHT